MKAETAERRTAESDFILLPSTFILSRELPGCTGTLIWKYRASSPAPDSDAISPLASLGANPCNPMLGKPTVATVAPSLTERLDATVKLNRARATALRARASLAAIEHGDLLSILCDYAICVFVLGVTVSSSMMMKPSQITANRQM